MAKKASVASVVPKCSPCKRKLIRDAFITGIFIYIELNKALLKATRSDLVEQVDDLC